MKPNVPAQKASVPIVACVGQVAGQESVYYCWPRGRWPSFGLSLGRRTALLWPPDNLSAQQCEPVRFERARRSLTGPHAPLTVHTRGRSASNSGISSICFWHKTIASTSSLLSKLSHCLNRSRACQCPRSDLLLQDSATLFLFAAMIACADAEILAGRTDSPLAIIHSQGDTRCCSMTHPDCDRATGQRTPIDPFAQDMAHFVIQTCALCKDSGGLRFRNQHSRIYRKASWPRSGKRGASVQHPVQHHFQLLSGAS